MLKRCVAQNCTFCAIAAACPVCAQANLALALSDGAVQHREREKRLHQVRARTSSESPWMQKCRSRIFLGPVQAQQREVGKVGIS